jgi:hypothetical protein
MPLMITLNILFRVVAIYKLFPEPPNRNLLQEPSFWITTGIAFLQGINIPVVLI